MNDRARALARVSPLLIGPAVVALVFWWRFDASPVPFAWLFGTAAVVCCGLLCRSLALRQPSAAKAVWLNAGVLMAALAVLEVYLAAVGGVPIEHEYGGPDDAYFASHPDLGYGPRKDQRIGCRTRQGERVVYDVQYTIDEHGLRATAGDRPADRSVLLFGGSFTFGEGVTDGETLADEAARRLAGRYRVHNFGFHGYGPHQMLAALESEWIDAAVAERTTHVVYQAIPPHVARAVGLSPWDPHGPRYVVDAEGRCERAGRFSDERWLPAEWVQGLHESKIYEMFEYRPIRDEEVDLYVSILRASLARAAARQPGCRFDVILWDTSEPDLVERIASRLDAAQIRIHRVSEIIPDIVDSPGKYRLDPADAHPNALAHRLIGAYVAERIVDAADGS